MVCALADMQQWINLTIEGDAKLLPETPPMRVAKLESVPIPKTTTADIAREIGRAAMPKAKPDGLCKGELAILNVLAQFPDDGRTKMQVSLISGYTAKSSGFKNSLSKLRVAGMIDRSKHIFITRKGSAIAPNNPLPKGAALIDNWVGKVGKCVGLILRYLYGAHPIPQTKEQISAATGYSMNSSGFNNALSQLRTHKLIEGYNEMSASDAFFS